MIYRDGSIFGNLFSTPIFAFGADFAAYNENIDRTAISVDGQVISAPVTSGATVRFFGFSSDVPFTTIAFQSVAFQSDGFGLDNVAWSIVDADALPAPGGLGLMAIGLMAIGLLVPRRGRAIRGT